MAQERQSSRRWMSRGKRKRQLWAPDPVEDLQSKKQAYLETVWFGEQASGAG